MEDRIKEFINDNKSFVIFYLTWFLFNLLILVTRADEELRGQIFYNHAWRDGWKITDKFWPFGSIEFAAYDISEFIFYLIAPFVLLGIWKLTDKTIINLLENYQSKIKNLRPTNPIDEPIKKQAIPMKRLKKSGVVTLLIITLITWFLFYSLVAWTEMQGKSSLEMAKNGNILLFILRIATIVTLVKKSKEIDESEWVWGFFGFILPPISLLVMLIKLNRRNKVYRKNNS